MIRPFGARDLDWVLAVNREHEAVLSVLDRDGLGALVASSTLAWAVPEEAFLIAMDQDADYEGWNFGWFRERFDRFIYVDRVAVARAAAGRGLGARLYDELAACARSRGYPSIAAEVDCDPPNQASLAFHDRLGFADVGSTRLPGGAKSVRYFLRRL